MMIEVNIMRSVMNRKIANHLALLINRAKNKLGSGLFAEVGDRRFVITAEHVIDGASDDDIYVNLGVKDQSHVLKKLNRWSNASLDLAFIELDRFESNIMRGSVEPFVMRAKTTLGQTPHYNGLAICGYPRSDWELPGGGYVEAHSNTIAIQNALTPDLWPPVARERYDPEMFTLISLKEEHLGMKLVDQDGNDVVPGSLDPHGMSGCPVWRFDVKTVNDDAPDYAFWGVLTGYLKSDPDILTGTLLNPIIEEIEKQYGLEL